MSYKVLFFLVLLAAPAFAQSDKTVLFTVEPYSDSSGWYVEPIASFRLGRFEEVVGHSVDPDAKQDGGNGELRAFTMDYFTSGTTYPLFSANKKIGLAVIKEADTMYACLQITARTDLRFSGMTSLHANEHALALNDELGRIKSVKRRDPLPEDSAEALASARAFLKANRVKADLVAKTELLHLHVLDLDGDGKAELVADFETNEHLKAKDYEWEKQYSLSLVLAEGDVGKWKIVYSDYYEGKSEEENRRREFVDAIDIDGDGICEMVFKNFFYEAWNYSIIMKTNGKWKQVFNGAGGGC